MQPSTAYYISSAAFSSLASKTDILSLGDLFLKMLMCTRGVTGDKAIEIQRVWRTPAAFIEAFECCGTGEEGKKKRNRLVMDRLGHLMGRKKVGKQLSVKIAEIWGGT